MAMSQHTQYQDHGTSSPKWNAVIIINVINYTYADPAITSNSVGCGKIPSSTPVSSRDCNVCPSVSLSVSLRWNFSITVTLISMKFGTDVCGFQMRSYLSGYPLTFSTVRFRVLLLREMSQQWLDKMPSDLVLISTSISSGWIVISSKSHKLAKQPSTNFGLWPDSCKSTSFFLAN